MNSVAICLSFTKYYNFVCSWYSKSVATRLNKSRSFTTHALRQVASQVRREQTRGRHSISYFPRKSDFYRPQTKFAKVCFHRCLSVHGGGGPAPLHAGIHNLPLADTTLLGRHPLAQTPPWAVHAGIRSTSWRYASLWNTFLLTSCARSDQ